MLKELTSLPKKVKEKYCYFCDAVRIYVRKKQKNICTVCKEIIPSTLFRKHYTVESFWMDAIKGKKCSIIRTSRTMQVLTNKTKHMICPEHLTGKELSLIRQVQRDTEKWYQENKDYIELFVKENLKKRVKYKNLSLGCLQKNLDKTVHCLDLKNAYPTFMFNKKIISQKTWDKISIVPKDRKLWIVGAIASTKYISHFEKGRELYSERIIKPTKLIWEYIVYEVDKFMRKLYTEFHSFYSQNYFSLAYYVDCLFVLCDSLSLMEVFFKEFSDIVFKEGYSYGYSQLILKDFDIQTKKITLAGKDGSAKIYFMTDDGYYHTSKLIDNEKL